jgi:polysaccharide pyruvyl transferase WcaK-like protein
MTSNRFSRVSILGASLDSGNRGVDALGASVVNLIRAIEPAARVTFHYYSSIGGTRWVGAATGQRVEVRNCRLSPRSRPGEHIGLILAAALLYRLGVPSPARRNPWLSALLDASFIADIRGGDSLSDIYGLRRFVLGSLPLLSALLLGRPYILLSQTYGPYRTRAARWLAALTLRRAAQVWTRDRHCIPLVEALADRTPDFSPDVAFTLTPVRPSHIPLEPSSAGLDSAPVLIGINVSGLLYMGGYTGDNMFGLRANYREVVEQIITTLLDRTTATILIVPHTFGAEMEEAAGVALLQWTMRRHPGRVTRLAARLGAGEVKWLIGRTHFFVGARMHACIGALSQGVPTVGLGYSDKFIGVFESAGIGDAVVDLRTHEVDAVSRAVFHQFQCRNETAARLREDIPRVQAQVRQAFLHMASWSTAGGVGREPGQLSDPS